ncbi:hypothetical protein LTR59_009623 [Friedmanniomyces endolithicus]|nr:hypothetical protein LTR94_004003 [Friedmanniomyces endolithicus]KAK0789380.1 hypothetical protein LTR59_009623 [Friedmanniomyces endolithicus]KAK0799342.1 hypothetical protein LTR38_007528 [Friedmanniomyces endolithicus]KAK0842584.1 hypothetical protein LTR03_009200 [Friedmanniomyces endolithicus]KAK0874189.1 hypothetical protein LTR87_011611 [Friedmanniomyces endolithicus]
MHKTQHHLIAVSKNRADLRKTSLGCREASAIVKHMVKQERKALSDKEIKDATGLGIKDPSKLQVYDLFSKTNGKQDGNRMAEILVSDNGSTIVASYTFAKFDGNPNKLDNKGNLVADSKGGFVRQDLAYADAHRL